MLHALAVDEFGNMQTDESPQTTVNVLNFRVADVSDLEVTAVDGVGCSKNANGTDSTSKFAYCRL